VDIYYDYRKDPKNSLDAEIGCFTRMERMHLENCGKDTFLPEEIRACPN
jgi:hypothetical protein